MDAPVRKQFSLAAVAQRWSQRWPRLEPLVYATYVGALTLWVACLFYSAMRQQTALTANPDALSWPGEWSAPLDDVFIHFDFARSTARGYPFQWSETNGYSSGGTSLLYPFVLALGYRVGFQGMSLMVWAAIVALVCVFGTLLATRRMFRNLPRAASYLAPPAFLGVGALAWTLFSGMEVALFLALCAGLLICWDDLTSAAENPANLAWAPLIGMGVWSMLVVATRPEAVTTVAVFSLSAAFSVYRRLGVRRAAIVLAVAALPGACVVVLHAIANKVMTGDFTAAGALVKLELHHPYLNAAQKWDAWKFHVSYQILRVTHYHMSVIPGFGWLVWALSALALVPVQTRRYALLLWSCALAWILFVATNGQVRWQNERYTMPAVAWLMLAAALGAGAILSGNFPRISERLRWRVIASAATVLAIGVYAVEQLPRYREQIWFFGRASRNIRDQHVRAGRFLRTLTPTPKRLLVGDAGALTYASDLPALDIIGLGGYKDLPFARASRLGVEAALELVERIPNEERPDVLAIYPSWWGTMPMWFGHRIAEFPVEGNVICGGLSKVIYRAEWGAFTGSGRPFRVDPGERVVDELDLADIVSERDHDFQLDGAVGYVQMKVLENPRRQDSPLWDAGRLLSPGTRAKFVVSRLTPDRPTRLILRTAPTQNSRVNLKFDGEPLGPVHLSAGDRWMEYSVALSKAPAVSSATVEIEPDIDEHVLYHLWVVQEQ